MNNYKNDYNEVKLKQMCKDDISGLVQLRERIGKLRINSKKIITE